MRLIKFELKKIIKSKITMITMLLMLIIAIAPAFSDVNTWVKRVGDVAAYNELVKPYEGKMDQKFKEFMYESGGFYSTGEIDNSISEEERRKLYFKINYGASAETSRMWLDSKIDNGIDMISVSGLKSICNNLEKQGKTDTYSYKDNFKHLNMLKESGQPTFYNEFGIASLFGYLLANPSIIIISCVLIIIVAPIFSNEKRNGMERVILSTKNGKRKIVKAKIVASSIFSILWVTIFYLSICLVYLIPTKSLGQLNIPLNCVDGYGFSPYNLTVLQCIILSYLITTLSACVLSIIFCLVSTLQKNNLSSIIIATMISILPIVLMKVKVVRSVVRLLPTMTLNCGNIFKSYRTYNILGNPVTYPIVAVVSLLIILVVTVFLTKQFYMRKSLK